VIGLIWAQARDGEGRPVVGKSGTMPWHLPEDLAHFRAVTNGHPVVMGRRTWESLPPRFRPLPGRTNIVITRQAQWSPGDGPTSASDDRTAVVVAASPAVALATAGDVGTQTWVIGGAQVWSEVLASADRCVVTDIDLLVDGDTFAPELDARWVTTSTGPWLTSGTGLRYRVRELVREEVFRG
jgi:dihydrofolate reductase